MVIRRSWKVVSGGMTVAVALGAGVASALPGPRLTDPTQLASLDSKPPIPDVRLSVEGSSVSPFDGLVAPDGSRLSLFDQDSVSFPSSQSVSPTSTTTTSTTTTSTTSTTSTTTTTTQAPDDTISMSVSTVSVSISSPQSND